MFAVFLAILSLNFASPVLLKGQHIALVNTTSADSTRLFDHIKRCTGQSLAFRRLLQAVPQSHPLIAHASDDPPRVLFGSAYDTTLAPRLNVDLREMEMLPTREEAMSWTSDSSWALTMCEMLGHEIAESVMYRELWKTDSSRSRFARRSGDAHRYAMGIEGEVAEDQRIRIRSDGSGYSRSHSCIRSGMAHIVLGNHTETLLFRGGEIEDIVYNENVDLCAGL